MKNILIVEDEALIRSSLKRLLERHQYKVSEAGSVHEATANFRLDEFDLVITDVRLPGEQGTSLIELAKPTPVLIMTSFGTMKSAVDAMKQGAVDYISKPFDHDEMLLSIARILREQQLSKENDALKSQQKQANIAGIIGSCAAMQELFKRISRVAPMSSTVLVRGESGTGKELVARALHEESPRRERALISVNCAAIPESLIEAELFGYEKGAFTGANTQRKGLVEAADGGTLFLDEIGELPLEAQARLLRLLQEKEVRRLGATQTRSVDVRLVAATHRNLKQLAAEGRFREDLYYRLNVIELKLPPLRERGHDIIEIADKLLEKTCQRLHVPALSFDQDSVNAMLAYSWPGNVRELENAIERAVILAETSLITPDLLAIELDFSALVKETPVFDPNATIPFYRDEIPTLQESVEEPTLGKGAADVDFQQFVLTYQDQLSETELAKRLGISRKSLWERRQRLGIPRRRSNASDNEA
ncbi:sigma-54-dependent transcriptional regulator [Agitococcus lubricus]|uniref:Two-component response regulator CbrB n=1 Tax=Agitococcus lubricus TaxID=1077255 RepID=A0A2T5IVD3_9GAMM|nr:sigma-54 dependent transcriptional regulator [Agitococcus lubricus]PTQ87842.1 two-component response regulator CbrB [Agitococcus lubricus]